MPLSTKAEISVEEALRSRDFTGERFELTCSECGCRVRAHAAGGGQGAHFEHFKHNPTCSLSHGNSTFSKSVSAQNGDTGTSSKSEAVPLPNLSQVLDRIAALTPSEPLREPAEPAFVDFDRTPAEILASIALLVSKNAPKDGSINHDHYLYGARRRDLP